MTQPREDRFDEVYPGSNFSAEEVEFFRAIDRYKRRSGRLFLSWHEVLRIARELGYRRVFDDERHGKRREKQVTLQTIRMIAGRQELRPSPPPAMARRLSVTCMAGERGRG